MDAVKDADLQKLQDEIIADARAKVAALQRKRTHAASSEVTLLRASFYPPL